MADTPSAPQAESCVAHPGVAPAGACARCGRSFCAPCLAPTPAGLQCEPCRLGAPLPARKGSPALFLVGVVVPALVIATLLVLVAIPNLRRARKHANERAAVSALQSIVFSEGELAARSKAASGKGEFGTLADLVKADVLTVDVGSGVHSGYRFEAHPSTDTPAVLWWAVARPEIPGTTGDHVYYVNQLGVVSEAPYAGGEHEPGSPDPRTCELPKGLAPVPHPHH